MKKKIRVFATFSLLALNAMLIGCGSNSQPVGRLVNFAGDVLSKTVTADTFTTVTTEQQFASGDSIKTGEEARAEIELISDKSQIQLSSNTHLEIKNFSEKELRQLNGIAIYKISPQNRELKIQTPQGMATVLGTTFRIDSSENGTTVTVEEGKVGFRQPEGQQVLIEAGMQYSTSFAEKIAISVDPLEREQLFNPAAKLKPIINPR